jgi:IS4 transposase
MQYHISMRRCPSVKSLMTIKDVTEEDAHAIRKVWRTVTNRCEARAQVDNILRTHGVEYLGQHKRTGSHVYYCNAGDSYASTVIFNGLIMRVQCWADLVEKNLIQDLGF